MPEPDRRVGVFIDKADRWQDELKTLRVILLDTPLSETFKWRQPVYAFEGGNVAILWTFKSDCGLGFFKGALMKDLEGLLVAPGENSRAARKMSFTSVEDIRAREAAIRAYVDEAIAIERAGLKVEMPKDDLEPPAELVDRLDADAAFREAFEGLTPGRRRGWTLHFLGAKKSETRAARIEKAAPAILSGKGMHD